MERFCMYCGEPLVKEQCVNPECPKNKDQAPEELSRKRPITLKERRRLMYEAEHRELCEQEEKETVYTEFSSEDDEIPEEKSDRKESTTEPKPSPVRDSASATVEQKEKTEMPREASRNVRREEQEPRPSKPKTEREKVEKDLQEEDEIPDNALIRLSFFVSDYYREPGKVVVAAARKKDVGIGVILVIATLCLSALGTLIFGAMYLEDFFLRWAIGGIIVPILAYGFSFLYGRLFVALSPVGKVRKMGKLRGPVSFRELFSVVTVSSVFPNQILLLSCVISPMDKDLGIFQFFALLLTITWIVSLLFSLFTVYGGGFSFGGLLLTVAFGFLAFIAMRGIWVWYLTGELHFSFYIPLSVFMK